MAWIISVHRFVRYSWTISANSNTENIKTYLVKNLQIFGSFALIERVCVWGDSRVIRQKKESISTANSAGKLLKNSVIIFAP